MAGSWRQEHSPSSEEKPEAELYRGGGGLLFTGLFLSLLSYFTEDHQARDDTTHSELGPSHIIINQENVPQACLQAKSVEVFS